jgi:hypothetical protein
MEPLVKLLAIRLMELLAIPLGYQKTAAKWLDISEQTALHSHSAKSPKYGDISRWLTLAKYTRKGYAVVVRG